MYSCLYFEAVRSLVVILRTPRVMWNANILVSPDLHIHIHTRVHVLRTKSVYEIYSKFIRSVSALRNLAYIGTYVLGTYIITEIEGFRPNSFALFVMRFKGISSNV